MTEPVYADEPGVPPPAERKVLFYRDPKAPSYTAHTPGVNPETGNTLEPVYAAPAETLPPGTVRIPPERQQLIGVKFGEVTPSAGVHSFRSVGQVTMDETRFTKVQTRIDGWIEKVYVDFTGKLVEKGQPLLTLYSPEMLASQQEYLLAIRSREIMKDSPLAGSRQQSDSLLAAARKRLELFSLSEAQIEEITRAEKPLTNITIYSPISGYVMMRNAFPKQRKEPLTDASHVRNAVARFDQVEDVSDADRDLAFANIKKAAEHYGVDVSESDWHDLGKKPHGRNP